MRSDPLTSWPRRAGPAGQEKAPPTVKRAPPSSPRRSHCPGEQVRELGLADLFGTRDTLFTDVWMFGPERARPCPICTSFVGSFDRAVPDIDQRLAIAIVGRSPVARQRAFARERGWAHL